MSQKVIVVGAGAAGIIGAWRAAELGADVTILEKTPRLGTKILISGGGKCNITHHGSVEEVLKAFRPNEARFLRPSFYRFFNEQILEILTSRGLRVYTRPDGRIFPVDQTAKDVVAILGDVLREAGVTIKTHTPVKNLVVEEGEVKGVNTEAGFLPASAVIVTVGGSSYPNSGTTGDGYAWAKELGHTVVPIRGALAPITLDSESLRPDLSGVAVRNCSLRARQGGKVFAKWHGDMLFTHQGVSGPCALGISREIADSAGKGKMTLEIDLFPEDSFEVVSEKVRLFKEQHPKKSFSSFVGDLVADRLVGLVLDKAEVVGATPAHLVPRKSLNRLVEVLKGWPIGGIRDIPIEKGEVVAGGVSLDEVDPHTCASKLISGLYWAGEVLDIAGPVGGYNLQAAFSTGYIAGESSVKLR